MGNTFSQTRGEVLDAVAGDVAQGSTGVIHRGCSTRHVRRDGLGAPPWHQSTDGVLRGSIAMRPLAQPGWWIDPAPRMTPRHVEGDRRGTHRGARPPPDVGRQDTPESAGHARADVDTAGAEYRLRSAGSRGPGHVAAAPPDPDAPGPAVDRDDGRQRDLDQGLLSTLSVSWMRLGLLPELSALQSVRHEYTDDRPHEPLGQETRPSNTPDTFLSVSSAAPAAFAGNAGGSRSPTPSRANTSALRKLATGCGTYTSDRCSDA